MRKPCQASHLCIGWSFALYGPGSHGSAAVAYWHIARRRSAWKTRTADYNPSNCCFLCLILESGCHNHRRNKTLWFVLNFEFR